MRFQAFSAENFGRVVICIVSRGRIEVSWIGTGRIAVFVVCRGVFW
jgi:hypothetical protein